MKTAKQTCQDIDKLHGFISNAQVCALIDLVYQGEEKEWFRDKVAEMATTVAAMPKTYEQDGMGDDAKIFLHYFSGGFDAWITEKDMLEEQSQAFGLVDLGYGPELGYVSITEIIEAGAELDLHFAPGIKSVGDIKAALKTSAIA